jgi:putative restriction endonuclease
MDRRPWSREELIVAFNLYLKTPFGKIHKGNPDIIDLARAIRRTPSAVSWKLANFARLDPALKKRNIAGATHGAKSEIEIREEFNNDWERLAYESERLLSKMIGRDVVPREDADVFPEGKTREAVVRTRINQRFFRSAVLAAYDFRCCITGLSLPELLNASHIIPWVDDPKNRTNPRNGLCLNAVHDRAFDCGLLTVTTEFKVKLSRKVRKHLADESVREFLGEYDGAPITLPSRFVPDKSFLKYHNEKKFADR